MDFHSVMETFAEAWVAANTHTPLTEAAEQGLINGPAGNHPPPSHGTTNNPPQNLTSVIPLPPNLPPGIPPPSKIQVPIPVPMPPNPASVVNTCHPLPPPNQALVDDIQPSANILPEVGEDRKDPECPVDIENGRMTEMRSPVEPSGDCPPMGEMKSPYKTLSNPHGKSLPVHCIVEQIPGPQACGQYVELDSYAIVPNDTLFSDLVRTALGKLGYSTAQILGAKGSIQVKKWKPLAFDQVTENPEATVADILGELTTVASLHVRLYSVPDNPQEWRDITVRNAVLELLREMSQSKLAKLCPLSQPMLSNIINNRYMGKIGKEKCQEFGQWYLAYRKQHPEGSAPEVVPNDRPLDGRLTFHPTKELPMMRDWFHGCRNPSKRTLQMYVDILNQGPVRQQERPKVVLSTLKNWWKNEKQRERKNLRSEDRSPEEESGRVKRKKRSSNPDDPKETSNDNSLQNFSGSSSQEVPKMNNFTMINHSGNESDPEKYSKKESEGLPGESFIGDSNHPFSHSGEVKDKFGRKIEPESFTDHLAHTVDSKPNGKFTIFSHVHPDGSIERFLRKEEEVNGKEGGVHMDLFQKLHPVCVDHGPALFGFSEHPPRLCCLPVGAPPVEGNNSHVSSEDDVDVGI